MFQIQKQDVISLMTDSVLKAGVFRLNKQQNAISYMNHDMTFIKMSKNYLIPSNNRIWSMHHITKTSTDAIIVRT